MNQNKIYGLTIDEAAAEIGLTRAAVAHWIPDRLNATMVVIGKSRHWIIDRAEWENFKNNELKKSSPRLRDRRSKK